VKLKDGTPSAGKRILIDGQQRVTLMAGCLGVKCCQDYETVRIVSPFIHRGKFEVANPPFQRGWVEDVADVFRPMQT
jgi:hypothetical protein